MKKTLSLILAAVMMFTVSLAMAKTVEPESTETDGLAGTTVHATVSEYNAQENTFTVILYDDDRFDIDKIEKLETGDTLLAGGSLYKVKEKTEEENGDILVVTEDGYEIVFYQVGDEDMIAQSTDDDRRYMHAFGILRLPAAAAIRYEDNSDPDKAEAVVTEGLENILKIKRTKSAQSVKCGSYHAGTVFRQILLKKISVFRFSGLRKS